MRKIKIILSVLLVLALPLLLFVGTSYAGSFRSGTNTSVTKNEVIDHTLFISGQTVQVDGTVKGDLFCGGQNVTVTGTVEGDVICAGMNVTVSGTVQGDVRLAGQTVSLSADVNRNASLAGSALTIASNARIGGDLNAAGNDLTLNGKVERDTDMAGKSVMVNGPVDRDLQVATDSLTLNADATIGGNLTYYSHNQLHQDSAAHIDGRVTRKDPPAQPQKNATNPLLAFIFSFVALLVLAYALLALFPRKLRGLTDLALTKPGTTVLIGLAACVAVPLLVVASFLTIIGFMAGLVLLLVWIAVMLLSGAFASYYAGRLIFMRSAVSPFVAMLTGVFVISILLLIPFVNILTGIAVMLFGSGMVVRDIFDRSPKPAYAAVSHPAAPSRKRQGGNKK